MAAKREVLIHKVDEQRSTSEVHPRLSPAGLVAKRIIDLVLALLAVTVFSPLMLLIALAIKLESRGPALYRQARVGRDGREFKFYKFRSMYDGADRIRQEFEHLNEADGPIFKIKNDPRITKVGHFIRKTSLDELPQFFNVIKGDMSMVGPRPPLPCEVAQYSPHHRQRLIITPGITCLWQISGRSNIGFERWVELDLEYIRNQSLWLDFKIMLKTIPAVVRGTGAH